MIDRMHDVLETAAAACSELQLTIHVYSEVLLHRSLGHLGISYTINVVVVALS